MATVTSIRGSAREPAILLALVVAALAVSAYRPADVGTWLLEVSPIIVIGAVLVLTFRRFRLSPLAYRSLAAAALLVALGAHYTYAEVPLGYWMQDWFGFARNHYDRLGHVAHGFVAAIVVRELLTRGTALRPGWRLVGTVTLSCMGISAIFEILEVTAGLLAGASGDSYLGTQGDPLDVQWDMLCALVGIVVSQAVLSRVHDRQIATIRESG